MNASVRNQGRAAVQPVSRRTCLNLGGMAIGLLLSSAKSLYGQEASVQITSCMTPLAGPAPPAAWNDSVTGLVSVIVDYSKPLRELDLGEIEPAVHFIAR